MHSLSALREAFLLYFEKQGHSLLPSSSLVPHNDPSLLFTNAGMVQFKNIFTGHEIRPYTRAVTSQKCVRAGGKHNDLENVGYTSRHHTFFEMLGNFSFGDYFKEEAIFYAWNFITKELGLLPERLYFTVYHDDDDAYRLWKKIAQCDDSHIIRIHTQDNFWSMGDTGPCGPCSEIFYDHGPKIQGGLPGSADQDGDRYTEIWNLVFMQYEQVNPETRILLPKPCIDTGMGLERLASVLQNKHDNYDTDLFRSLIDVSQELSGNREALTSHRVIADHLRASCFLMADGVTPSNEGRGYVLRRIMRRAMRHVHMMGVKNPLMYKLVPSLLSLMGNSYPELIRAQASITDFLHHEEEKFKETLSKGLRLLEQEKVQRTDISSRVFSGEVAFKLYDTYGFPFDLTKDILREEAMTVDEAEFEACMALQKERARAAWSGSGDEETSPLWHALLQEKGPSDFVGYQNHHIEAFVNAIIVDNMAVESAVSGQKIGILLNQTPFYAESGGQIGDRGVIISDAGMEIVIDTTVKKQNILHLHMGKIIAGTLSVGDKVKATIDEIYRSKIRANHSATHLLHAALRLVLGEHVVQKGSLVTDEKLRFDFSHAKAVTSEELYQIEHKINGWIRHNYETITHLMSPEEALNKGAIGLFGENYGEEVRVVHMGKENSMPSMELCGGTHVTHTGDIGLFRITQENAVASGIRRIEACSGEKALDLVFAQENKLHSLSGMLKCPVVDIETRIQQLLDMSQKNEKHISELRKKNAMVFDESLIEKIQNIFFIGKHVEEIPASDLRAIADYFLQKISMQGVVMLTSFYGGKTHMAIMVSSPLSASLDAVVLIKKATEFIHGQGGGGKVTFAQSGGPLIEDPKILHDFIKNTIENILAS